MSGSLPRPSDERTFAVIGPGRLGLHLTLRLHSCGWQCLGVRGRRLPEQGVRKLLPRSIPFDTWNAPDEWGAPTALFVCVPDRKIVTVADQLVATCNLKSTTVLHTSGLATSATLTAAARAGAAIASWHPLQSFPPLSAGTVAWRGVACAVEGDSAAVDTGFLIARELGLEPWQISPEQKPLYHAAASVAGNLTHVLVVAANQLMAVSGHAGPGSLLRPLVRQSIEAALAADGLESLTGPLARGDLETVELHLQALPPAVAGAYRSIIALVDRLRETPPYR
jgi:predicted short-subunit dehydrogenase-like oxidoreductase (DUF2520 family)